MMARTAIGAFLLFAIFFVANSSLGPKPKFKHLLPFPKKISSIRYLSKVSFDYSRKEDAAGQPEWTLHDSTLTDDGYQLTVLNDTTREKACAISTNAIDKKTAEWRMEALVTSRFVTTPDSYGWFGVIISTNHVLYDTKSGSNGNFQGLVGVALFIKLTPGGVVFLTVNANSQRPTENTAIPGQALASEPNCDMPGVIFDETGIASYTLIVQVVSDEITVALVPDTALNTANFCFQNVKAPGLGKITASGKAQVMLMGMRGFDGETVVSRLRFFRYISGGVSTADMSKMLDFTSDTGFPIPSLIDGNIYPVVKMRDLFDCPSIIPDVKSPDFNTSIYALFKVERMVGIDAMQGSIDLFASLYLQWEVKACPSEYTAPEANQMERIFVANAAAVLWQPKLLFANSSNDVYMKQAKFGEKVEIMYLPTEPNRTLYFHWIRLGIFSSRCILNLRYFPFDTQECDFTFLIEEPTKFVSFGGVFLSGDVLKHSDRWIFHSSNETFGVTASVTRRNGFASFIKILLNFRRDPTHYIVNLLVPCYILVILVFGSFLMRPEMPERSSFCGMILLALTVAQSDVLNAVPQTSQRILFAENILTLSSLTGMVTLYDMAVCSFARFHSSTVKLRQSNFRLVRLLDFFVFICTLGVVLGMALYGFISPIQQLTTVLQT